MEVLSQAKEMKDFVKSSRVGNKVFIAQCCSHNHGRFLSLAKYGSGCRRRFIVILEGRDGKGTRGFALEFRRILELF
jgi:hypothetical protein